LSTRYSYSFWATKITIAMKDGRPFTFAGLWENWKDPDSGEWLPTCTIITGEPNELVAQIHPRMPVILPERQAELGRSRPCREIRVRGDA
jgi:putative SOS response-associated peptidase YedK